MRWKKLVELISEEKMRLRNIYILSINEIWVSLRRHTPFTDINDYLTNDSNTMTSVKTKEEIAPGLFFIIQNNGEMHYASENLNDLFKFAIPDAIKRFPDKNILELFDRSITDQILQPISRWVQTAYYKWKNKQTSATLNDLGYTDTENTDIL